MTADAPDDDLVRAEAAQAESRAHLAAVRATEERRRAALAEARALIAQAAALRGGAPSPELLAQLAAGEAAFEEAAKGLETIAAKADADERHLDALRAAQRPLAT